MPDYFSEATTRILYDAAERLGLKPETLTPSGLISIQIGSEERYLFQSHTTLNSQFAYWLVTNKYATRTVLARHGLPNIPYTRTRDHHEAKQFLRKYKKIIVKPVAGSRSENVRLVTSPRELAAVSLPGKILEQYIEGREMRYLLLDGDVLAVHHKDYDGPVNDPKTLRHVSLERDHWDSDQAEMAIKTLTALGVRYGAVITW